MSVGPLDLIDSARLIRETQPSEAGQRAAISRAYYAAFHAAAYFHAGLASQGKWLPQTGSHGQLINQLAYPTIASTDPAFHVSRRIGNMLRDVYRERVLADYKLTQNLRDADVEFSMRTANAILKDSEPAAKL